MSRNYLSNIILFVAGAGVGSFMTYKILEKKHEEEIESVRSAFDRVYGCKTARHDESDENTTDEIEEVSNVINQNGYVTLSENKVEKEESDMETKPYVISPNEFGDCDYVSVTLWYYTDGVVTNDNGKVIGNVDELIGDDFAEHYGEYEEDPDTVYVRNDKQKIDYQILAEYRAYSEM